jgi:DNA repair exonuclease SbcCD ATPase subunit
MPKALESAARNVSRLNTSLSKKEAQLTATKERMAQRLRNAEEAVRKAQERLAKVQAEAERLIAKRTEELERTKESTRKAEERYKKIFSKPVKMVAPAGSVETVTGEVRNITKTSVQTITHILGRRRKGVLSPLDGAEAQAILSALDSDGSVGDVFEVRIKGRKTTLMFSVEADGLHFETVLAAVRCAA